MWYTNDTSHVSTILLKNSTRIFTHSMNDEMKRILHLVLSTGVLNRVSIYLRRCKLHVQVSYVIRQEVIDWWGSKGCGCYCMSTDTSSLIIQNAISVQTSSHGIFRRNAFSLFKFSNLYLNGDILGPCKLYILQLNNSFMNLLSYWNIASLWSITTVVLQLLVV